jgi:toxin-antitoxin system PIN domain toxin
MSYSVDVNILLYASNESDPLQPRASRFLADQVRTGEAFYLAWPTLMGFVRLATHPSIFDDPFSQDEAEDAVGRLLALPQVRPLSEADGFWEVYRQTSGESGPITGKLVPDSHVATILKQHGVRRFYTRDRDYRRFDFLDVIDPF